MPKKTIVMIPTYNERENIGRLIGDILALEIRGHELHALVVDDNSPDGTSQAVEELARQNPRVHLMTRKTERGRGSAGIAGFREALRMNADFSIEMDADFSHDPKYIPAILAAADEGYDVVIGSRFVRGGSDDDRGPVRQVVTKLAGVYVRTLLKLRIRDVSSGYRCFSRKALEELDLGSLISTGPSIVLEILFRCALRKMRIKEIPIVFIDRRLGETKLNVGTLMKTLMMVARFRALKETNRLFRARDQQRA